MLKVFFIESYTTYEKDFILGTIQKYHFKSPYFALPFIHWYALPVTASKLTITAACELQFDGVVFSFVATVGVSDDVPFVKPQGVAVVGSCCCSRYIEYRMSNCPSPIQLRFFDIFPIYFC